MINEEIKKKIQKLPEDAAPFLSFEPTMKSVSDTYEVKNKELDNFIYIGADGEGNPISINLEDNQIYFLDHENSFTPYYMNKNIDDLMMFLSLYEKHIENIQEKYGEDAYMDFQYPISEIETLKNDFNKIDKTSTDENSFWGSTIMNDKAIVESEQ